ncbi:hypothetical protein AX14_002461 [Amanita brunnescens Koide BX004]|nr:hypothetical protein AX14_002461 [Amanita brunnescens Koide BX004]
MIQTGEAPISRKFGGKFTMTLIVPYTKKDPVIIEDWRSVRLDNLAESARTPPRSPWLGSFGLGLNRILRTRRWCLDKKDLVGAVQAYNNTGTNLKIEVFVWQISPAFAT